MLSLGEAECRCSGSYVWCHEGALCMEWNVILANYVTYVTQVTVVTSLAIEKYQNAEHRSGIKKMRQ